MLSWTHCVYTGFEGSCPKISYTIVTMVTLVHKNKDGFGVCLSEVLEAEPETSEAWPGPP